jgi:hypothetical protein
MNKAILISMAAAVSLAAAAPALAQPYNSYNGYNGSDQSRPYGGISHRVDYLTTRINEAQQQRTISWREANRLRTEVNNIRWSEQRDLTQGGLNDWQRTRLNQRLDDVASELHN